MDIEWSINELSAPNLLQNRSTSVDIMATDMRYESKKARRVSFMGGDEDKNPYECFHQLRQSKNVVSDTSRMP